LVEELEAKMEAIQAIRFDLDTDENVERMLVHLNDYGYAVISSVASEAQIEEQKNVFWDFVESLDRGIQRNDPETWNDDNWVGNKSTGIIRSPDFCHSDFMWNTRLLPKVKRSFAHIWNSEELITSFDAGNAFRPWKYDRKWKTEGNWWHVDQNYCKGKSRQGRVSVQGLVTYYDVTTETGGLCLIPGSHLFHEEVCNRSPSWK
jgi:ectoine hydroxylase-related dioxygenase (phytanoyl-CoA dioxygenase family)